MSFVANEGCRIHYIVEGEGPPLVLHHWSFASLDFWYDFGYVEALAGMHRLLLLDSRGHGRSDAPHDTAAYGPQTRVGDVTAVLDDVGVDRAAFFGYSMGGWIGFCMAAYAPDRLSALLIGGQHPQAQDLSGLRDFLRIGVEQGAAAFVASWESQIGPLMEDQRNRMLAYDFVAMTAAAQDRESLEFALPRIAVPCLVFAGDQDPAYPLARESAQAIPGATFVSFAGLDHGGVIARSDLVVPVLHSFLNPETRSSIQQTTH
jgi:pimeloyl-ACP methyl ester carboxylesterase